MQCNVMQCTELQCSALQLQYSAVQCSAVNGVVCHTWEVWNDWREDTQHVVIKTALYCTVLHCAAQTALQCTAPYCTLLHWTIPHPNCSVLHCTALHWPILHHPSIRSFTLPFLALSVLVWSLSRLPTTIVSTLHSYYGTFDLQTESA